MARAYLIYDGRANALDGTKDASVISVCHSLEEAREEIKDGCWGECYIWSYVEDKDGNLLDETFEE